MESNHLPLPYAKTAHSLMCFSGHIPEQDPAHHGRRDPYSVVRGTTTPPMGCCVLRHAAQRRYIGH